ncbi:hypothetical protein AN958_01268 [Leucoagaricus sp. SymC.cos]|nr:hypothetical protein AN958_01268 [Leucoagaricus sp. SymC.cos]
MVLGERPGNLQLKIVNVVSTQLFLQELRTLLKVLMSDAFLIASVHNNPPQYHPGTRGGVYHKDDRPESWFIQS